MSSNGQWFREREKTAKKRRRVISGALLRSRCSGAADIGVKAALSLAVRLPFKDSFRGARDLARVVVATGKIQPLPKSRSSPKPVHREKALRGLRGERVKQGPVACRN